MVMTILCPLQAGQMDLEWKIFIELSYVGFQVKTIIPAGLLASTVVRILYPKSFLVP